MSNTFMTKRESIKYAKQAARHAFKSGKNISQSLYAALVTATMFGPDAVDAVKKYYNIKVN